ncbi:MAG: hypothetical protein R6V85_03485 [Polyangia bacterium]
MGLRVLLLVCFSLVVSGCMDPLENYRACVRIEKARCELRKSCDSTFDRASCESYYEEFCRTRHLEGPGSDALTSDQVDACVEAILAYDCALLNPGIDETESIPECGFIEKPSEDAGSDAGTDTDTGSESDTGTDTDTGPQSDAGPDAG